jgi:hypothetical protein
MGDTQLKLYTQLLAIAKSIDGQESSSTEVVGDEFIESRE